MDAIRAAHAGVPFDPRAAMAAESAALDRFRESMRIDYERWHDGIGYDLDALRAMSPLARSVIETSLTPPGGWRDVEALAELDTVTAADTLREAATRGTTEIRMAVLSYAPHLVSEADRIASIVRALGDVRPFDGLSATLDEVMDFHPPPIMDALFSGLLTAPGESAYHFAATLATIQGAVESRYDWTLRPLFLEFNTDDMPARRHAFLALCTTMGIDGPAKLAALDRVQPSPTGDH